GAMGRTITAFPVVLTESTYPQQTTRIVSLANASDLAIARDGRIAVAGYCEPLDGKAGNTADLAVAVYGSNGHPDPTFGDRGRLMFDFGTGSRSWSNGDATIEVSTAVAFAADGDLLVAGAVAPGRTPSSMRGFVARFDASGCLVPSFGNGGLTCLT